MHLMKNEEYQLPVLVASTMQLLSRGLSMEHCINASFNHVVLEQTAWHTH